MESLFRTMTSNFTPSLETWLLVARAPMAWHGMANHLKTNNFVIIGKLVFVIYDGTNSSFFGNARHVGKKAQPSNN
jgi:hypothetical protein